MGSSQTTLACRLLEFCSFHAALTAHSMKQLHFCGKLIFVQYLFKINFPNYIFSLKLVYIFVY